MEGNGFISTTDLAEVCAKKNYISGQQYMPTMSIVQFTISTISTMPTMFTMSTMLQVMQTIGDILSVAETEVSIV